MTRLTSVTVAAAVLAVAGCGHNPTAAEFVPSEESARSSLDASLQAWVKGDINSPVPGTHPSVEVADGLRKNGRRLTRYEILGPVASDAPRCFAVRLTLANPDQEVRERYVVLGIDPVWVWRYDDYVMLTHWDHTMMTPDSAKKPPVKR